MDNAWKDKLRDRFSDYSVPEPEGLWEGIEQGLAGKSRRRMPATVWWLSGSLAAAAAVALVVFLPGTGRQSLEADRAGEAVAYVEPKDEVAAPSVPDTTGIQVVPEAQVPAAVPASAHSAKKSTPFGVVSRQTLLADADIVKDEIVLIPETPEEETVPEEIIPEEKVPSEVRKPVPAESVSRTKEEPEDVFPIDLEEKKKVRRAFSIGLYHQGGQAATDQSQGFGMQHTGGIQTRAAYNNGYNNSADKVGLMNMLATNSASTYDARHRAPVRIGVQAAWQMTDHLGLVTGVNWTTLHSQFKESTISTRTEVDQELGYLGVPLRLQASFNPWNRLWLYADAGGMVEKGLQASSLTKSFIGNHLEKQEIGTPDTGGLLWSVGASAGAEYRFTKHLGVYFAPGLEYHFDNGSDVSSAYTDHPLHWNFSLGLRFSFGN